MAPQEIQKAFEQSKTPTLPKEAPLSFAQKLQEQYVDILEPADATILAALDTALKNLPSIQGDGTMPGKRIAYEKRILDEIAEVPEGEVLSRGQLLIIINKVLKECATEQKINIEAVVSTEEAVVTTQEAVVTTQEVEEVEQKTKEREQKTTEARESAKKNAEEIEKILGPGGLEKALGGNYEQLLEKAKLDMVASQKAKKLPPLSEESLLIEARTQVFLNNRKTIVDSCSPEQRDQLNSAFDALALNAQTLKIEYKTTSNKSLPPLPIAQTQSITNDPSFTKDKTIIRKGSELIAQSTDGSREIWNLSTVPPTKRVELSGLSISSRIAYKPNFEYLTMKHELETKIKSLGGNIGVCKERLGKLGQEQTKLENIIQTEQKEGAQGSSDTQDTAKDLGLQMPKQESEGKAKLVTLQADIQETKVYLEKFEAELESAKKELGALETKESTRVSEYQSSMNAETECLRSNLQFFDSIGLSGLSQEKLEGIVKVITQSRIRHGEPNAIDLRSPLSPHDKNAFIRTVETLMRPDGEKLFVVVTDKDTDVSTTKLSPTEGTSSQIKKTLSTIDKLHISNIKGRLANFDERKPVEYISTENKPKTDESGVSPQAESEKK